MPASDHSYMNLMDENVSIDDIALENPLEDDVCVIAPTPKRKSIIAGNYTVKEDKALILAWESVTLDAIIGVEQNRAAYWKRIARKFYEKTGSKSRTISSLQHRWGIIKECCSRWAGCIKSFGNAYPSGTNADDRKFCLHKLYKERELRNKSFIMEHCWKMLEDNEKWRERGNDLIPNRKSSSSIDLDEDGDQEEGEESRRSSTPSSTPTKERPPGRKREKEKAKRGEADLVILEGAVEKMVYQRKEVEIEKKEYKVTKWEEAKAIEREKMVIEREKLRLLVNDMEAKKIEAEAKKTEAEAKRLAEENKIFLSDINTMNPQQRMYVEMMCSQILSKKMAETFGSESGGGGVE